VARFDKRTLPQRMAVVDFIRVEPAARAGCPQGLALYRYRAVQQPAVAAYADAMACASRRRLSLNLPMHAQHPHGLVCSSARSHVASVCGVGARPIEVDMGAGRASPLAVERGRRAWLLHGPRVLQRRQLSHNSRL